MSRHQASGHLVCPLGPSWLSGSSCYIRVVRILLVHWSCHTLRDIRALELSPPGWLSDMPSVLKLVITCFRAYPPDNIKYIYICILIVITGFRDMPTRAHGFHISVFINDKSIIANDQNFICIVS